MLCLKCQLLDINELFIVVRHKNNITIKKSKTLLTMTEGDDDASARGY